jgi:hypothetical protein
MSIADKLNHQAALVNRLLGQEERLASLVSRIGGHYPIAAPEGGKGSPADSDDMLQQFESNNRTTVFALDRVEQHLAMLQQYVNGDQTEVAAAAAKRDGAFANSDNYGLRQTSAAPETVVLNGATYHRLD